MDTTFDDQLFYEKVQRSEAEIAEIESWLGSHLHTLDIPMLSKLISLLEQKKLAYDLSIHTYTDIYRRLAEFKKTKNEVDSYKHHIIKTATDRFTLAKLLNNYGSYNPALKKEFLKAIRHEDQEEYEAALKIYTLRRYVPGIIWISSQIKAIINNPTTQKDFQISINYQISTGRLSNIESILDKMLERCIQEFQIQKFDEFLNSLRGQRGVLPSRYNEAPYGDLSNVIEVERLVKSKRYYEAYYYLLALNQKTEYSEICKKLMRQIRHAVKVAKDFFEQLAQENGFTKRQNQIHMSNTIQKAIAQRKTVMLEAEVGIGKSFAYLIPSLLSRHYTNSNKAIIVSTSSIVLQNQLIDKDIPKINQLLQTMYGIEPISSLIGKGKTHFACSKRVDRYIDVLRNEIKFDNLSEHTVRKKKQLEKELVSFYNTSKFLDKSDAIDAITKDFVWRRISAEKCTCQKNCKYLAYREALIKHSGVIVCNHQQLLAHLKNEDSKRGIFPPIKEIGVIIIDEAHKLEDAAKTVYTNSFSLNGLKEFQQELGKIVKSRLGRFNGRNKNGSLYKKYQSLEQSLNSIEDALSLIGLNLSSWLIPAQFEDSAVEQEVLLETDGARFKINLQLANKTFNGLYQSLKKVHNVTIEIAKYEDEINYLYRQLCLTYAEVVENVFDRRNFLSFVEKDLKENWIFCTMRKAFGDVLNQKLMKLTQPVILVSGTLRVNNSFVYIANKIGYTNSFMKPKSLNNDFDYEGNRFIYIPRHLPSPSVRDNQYYEKIAQEIIRLLELTKGRSLVLFTNYTDLDEIFKRVSQSQIPLKLLKQEKYKTTEQLISEFKTDISSCLFASGSFFEGFDVPGEALEHVILVKLPYPVLDPVLEDELKKAGDQRMERVLLPKMIIHFNQAVGRLIRRETDKGIVSILDSRLYRRNYAATPAIENAISPSKIYSTYEEISRGWSNHQ